MKRKISTASLSLFSIGAAIVLFLVSFFFGGFASHYNDSACYQQLVGDIHQQLKQANDPQDLRSLNQALSKAEQEQYKIGCDALRALLADKKND